MSTTTETLSKSAVYDERNYGSGTFALTVNDDGSMALNFSCSETTQYWNGSKWITSCHPAYFRFRANAVFVNGSGEETEISLIEHLAALTDANGNEVTFASVDDGNFYYNAYSYRLGDDSTNQYWYDSSNRQQIYTTVLDNPLSGTITVPKSAAPTGYGKVYLKVRLEYQAFSQYTMKTDNWSSTAQVMYPTGFPIWLNPTGEQVVQPHTVWVNPDGTGVKLVTGVYLNPTGEAVVRIY